MCNSRGLQTAGYVHGPPMKNPLVIQHVDLVLNCSITLPKELQNIYSWLPLSLSLSVFFVVYFVRYFYVLLYFIKFRSLCLYFFVAVRIYFFLDVDL